MFPDGVEDVLKGNNRPESIEQVKREVEEALAKGYKVPAINFDEGIFTKQQAISACRDILGINKGTLFYELYINYRYFPLGKGSELSTLDQVVEDAESGFHSDEYPEIGKRYLQISSIEGEGSYFYDKETDAVYDVHWGEEEDMISGRKEPWFHSFYDFLEWYYSDDNEE